MRWFRRAPNRPIAHVEPEVPNTSVRFEDAEKENRERLLVLMLGLDLAQVRSMVGGLVSRARARGREPIFVVDRPIFKPFRKHDVVVEMIPRHDFLSEPDPVAYLEYASERLESIRTSWRTTYEISLGVSFDAFVAAQGSDPVDRVG